MSRGDVTIRPGRGADARALAAMANELNLFEGKPGDVYGEELVKAQAFGASPLFSVLVAEADGELVGYAFFHDSYNSAIAASGVWLHDLFVREHARSLGVGRRLMAAVARAFYVGLGAKDEDTRMLELDEEALSSLADAAGEG